MTDEPKSGKGKILLSLLAFFALLAGGGYFAFRQTVLKSSDEAVRTARNHLNDGDPVAARRSLEWLLHFAPDNQSARLIQAATFEAEGVNENTDRLIASIQPEALEATDGILFASLLMNSNQYERAEDALLVHAPKSSGAVGQLVRMYLIELRLPEAIRLYVEYWRTDRIGRPTLLSLLELISANPSSDAYIAQLTSIDSQQPNQLPIVLSLATAAAQQGDNEEARSRFESALSIAPDDLRTRLLSGRFFLDLGEAENAAKLLTFEDKTAAEASDQYWYLQSRLAESNGEFDTALANLDRAITLHPQSETYLQLRARLLRSDGQVDEAVKVTQQCAELAKARQELGQLYGEAETHRFSRKFCNAVADRLETMQYTEVAKAWREIAN